jgi:hypothetical protein
LVNLWIAESDGTKGASQAGAFLDEKEKHAITEIHQIEHSAVMSRVEALLWIDLAYFIRVRNQILLLLIA